MKDRGGKRNGAGRPMGSKKPETGKPVKFYLYEGEKEKIKEFIKKLRA